MYIFHVIRAQFTRKERVWFLVMLGIFVLSSVSVLAISVDENSEFIPIQGGVYTEGVVGQPIIINPIVSSNSVDQDLSALLFSPMEKFLSIPPEPSPDGRIYTLKLKEKLIWDDGEPFTSNDVVFTISTIQNPETRSPLAKSWQGVTAERVSEIQVKLSLPTPYVFFGKVIQNLPVIPQHIFGAIPIENLRLSSYNLQPVGNGPYRFEDFSKRKDGFITRYRLVENELYQGDRPFIKEIRFQFYETQAAALNDLNLRKIQGFGSLLPISSKEIKAANIETTRFPMPRYYGIFLNSITNSALKDRDIRRALSISIDRERIAKEILGNEQLAIETPIFPELFETSDHKFPLKNYTFQNTSNVPSYEELKKEAERLLASKKEEVTINLMVPDMDFLVRSAQIIQENWNSIGIQNASITILNSNELQDAIRPRNYETLLFGNVLENPIDLFPFFHSSQRFHPGLNLSIYQDENLDKVIEEIRQSTDRGKDTSRLDRIQSILQAEMPAIFLFSFPYVYLHTNRLGGIVPHALISASDRFLKIEHWSITKARILK